MSWLGREEVLRGTEQGKWCYLCLGKEGEGGKERHWEGRVWKRREVHEEIE